MKKGLEMIYYENFLISSKVNIDRSVWSIWKNTLGPIFNKREKSLGAIGLGDHLSCHSAMKNGITAIIKKSNHAKSL